ncbi:MAG TPA: ATP synthase subunit C [Planctomycetota bacterium]|nr:ATP synthase subunit C [Planctomycetota bacterium]
MNRLLIQFVKCLTVVLIIGNVVGAFVLPQVVLAAGSPENDVNDSAPAPQQQQQQTAFPIAIVVGVSCLAAGYAVGRVGSAAVGAVSERPEMFGRALVFVGLAEGIAIYGLIIGIMLMLVK